MEGRLEVLFAENIIKEYTGNKQVLKGVNFSLQEGKITGFVGKNGAGKTTLMKIILGFTKPTSGKVIFSDDLLSDGDFRKNLGFLPEKPSYYMNLTGREQLYYLGLLSGMSNAPLRQAIEFWCKEMDILDAIGFRLSTYSKGMLQRLGLVAVMLHRPKLVLLDEPLSGLDPKGRSDLKTLICDVNKKQGVTVFFSSHIVSDLEEISDNIILLRDGLIHYCGSLEAYVRNQQETHYDVSYLNAKGERKSTLVDSIKVSEVIKKIEDEKGSLIYVKLRSSLEEIFYEKI